MVFTQKSGHKVTLSRTWFAEQSLRERFHGCKSLNVLSLHRREQLPYRITVLVKRSENNKNRHGARSRKLEEMARDFR